MARTGIIFNPHLSHFDFDLHKFAFLVESRNASAESFLHENTRWIQSGYEKPIYTHPPAVEEDEERATPAVDDKPSAWLFPIWKATKASYVFGTYKSDIVLPKETRVSKRHFALYLNEQDVWMVQNFSKFGTYVNGCQLENPTAAVGLDLDQSSSSVNRRALDPDAPNVIVAGRLEFIVHAVPHTASPFMASGTVFSLPTLSYLELSSQTSTVGTSDSTLRAIRPPIEAYYYLSNRPVPVQGPSKVFMAVHKQTGYYHLAKVYGIGAEKRAGEQYEMMLKLSNRSNIISYSEFIDTEDGLKIITPYLPDAEPLADIRGVPGIELSFLVFKHISGALGAMEENRIVHNGINEDTIIIEYNSGRYIAYLTGFSEFYIASGGSRNFRHDLSTLTSIVKGRLPTYKERSCCDPPLRSLLSKSLQEQISASQVSTGLEKIAAGYESCPFKTLWVKKVMSIKRIVDENNTEAVRLLDFLRIVLHHNPVDLESMEDSIRRVVRKERLFQLESETYCYLEDAQKLMHYLESQRLSFILDLSPPSHREACWYETKHEIVIPISYHEPSQMVNVTHVLNLFNDEKTRGYLQEISPMFQELRGTPQWEGYYIDRKSIDQMLGRLDLEISGSCRVSQEASASPCAFSDNDSNHFVIIAALEMVGLIFLSRDGKTVKWNDLTQTIDAAIIECEEHGLLVAQSAIRQGVSSDPEWTSFYEDTKIMNLFGSECPSEATEHNSFVFSEKTRFRPRKRKGYTDVPILPQPREFSVRKTTAREKCEAWFKSG